MEELRDSSVILTKCMKKKVFTAFKYIDYCSFNMFECMRLLTKII